MRFVRIALAAALASLALPALAQTYPSGPVKLIVPVPAGGVTDTMARIVAQRLQAIWGQSVVVENRPGGNYGVGTQAVEQAAPDGLTLLVAPDSTFTANPALFSKLIYKPDGLTPIALLSRATPMFNVHPSLPVKTIAEFIAYTKANPGKLSYGSFGTGTYAHLSMEDFKRRTGIEVQHVPYRGAAPGLTGLLGNEVSAMLLNLSSVEENAKAGRVRILAAATEARVSSLPDLPTVAETVPGFNTSVWFGLWGPAKLPPDVLAKIYGDVAKVLALPETQAFFKTNGFERVDLTPDAFGKLIASDLKHWTGIIDAVGAKID